MRQDKLKSLRKARRIRRIKKKVFGTKDRPRLAFTKTNKNLYAQIIDDMKESTLLGISSTNKVIREAFNNKKSLKSKDVAKKLAELIAENAKKKKIEKIVFDRRGRQYMGVVKVFADTLRDKGLEF